MSLKKIESQVYLTAFNNAHLSESFIHLLAANEPVKDVDFLLTHHWFQTSDKYDANTPGKGEHLYRGQSNAEWQICPSVFRNPLCLDTYTPQGPGKYDQEITDIKHWLGMHLHAELRSIAIFLDSADKQGIETPIDFALLTKHRKIIRRSFDGVEEEYSEDFPNADALESFALAQHHGVPTRLVDWSESPLVACYFAAVQNSNVVKESKHSETKEMAIFCITTDHLYKTDVLTMENAPRHRNNFLRVQEGLFTHMPKANSYFRKHKQWPSIEDIIKIEPKLNGALKRYRLPASEADDMLRILFDLGISRHQLMPTLDNIARTYEYVSKIYPEE